MNSFINIAQILGNIGQFVFGLLAATLSIIALVMKRSDIFKSELSKSQFAEIGLIRTKLSEIFFDIFYVSQFEKQMQIMGWSLEDLRRESPDQWEQYLRYKENSLDLFYKFMTPDYYLFPKWMSDEKVKSHFEEMRGYAPFTISATGSKSSEEIKTYQNKVANLIKYIDVELVKHA